MEEVANLPPLDIGVLQIRSTGWPTCVDGKNRCYWSDLDGAMGQCPVCGASGDQLAELWIEGIFDQNPPSRLQFFVSPVHCEMQIMRWLIKGTTHQDFENWQARGDNIVWKEIRQVEVEEAFKNIMGIELNWQTWSGGLVSEVFARPKELAEVLEIYPFEWLEDLRIIFETMNIGYCLNHQKVSSKLWSWIERFHSSSIGQWHRPSVYVHLLFHHFGPMLEFFPVPPGVLNEQGSEAKNKVFRYDRAHHARQTGPVQNLQDVALRSHHRGHPQTQALMVRKKVHKPLDPEVIAMLADPSAVLVTPAPAAPVVIPEDYDDDAMDAEGDAPPEAAPEADMEVDD